MKYTNHILSLSFFIFAFTAEAKRAPGAEIKPISRHGNTYSYVIENLTKGCAGNGSGAAACGGRIFMVAKTVGKDSHQVWKTELYNFKYNMKMETDVQMVLPRALKFRGADRVELTDERERRYIVREAGGKLYWPATIRIYHAPRTN
jgi:hypothetical protein